MSSKIGESSPEELQSQLMALDQKVRETRREHLANLIQETDELAQTIATELKLDQSILQDEKARYREEFSFFDRINPFNIDRHVAKKQQIEPVKDEVKKDRALLSRCCELGEWVRNASQPIEWRSNWHGGIAGVYNEHTGQTEWRESWHTGIAGVYHPDRREIQWRECWKHGVAGVFNPLTREIEWREYWHGGVAGVFNPKKQEIEWRDGWHMGVCGIYNPVTELVEWKESWKAGVAGAWCPDTKTVHWHENWKCGVGCIFHDGTTYRSSGSYYGDEDDD